MGPDTVFFRMRNNELLNFYRGEPVNFYVLSDFPKSMKLDKFTLGPDPEKGEASAFLVWLAN